MDNELDNFSLEPIPGIDDTLVSEISIPDIKVSEFGDTIFEEPIPGNEEAKAPLGEPLRKCIICNEPLADWQQALSMQVFHKDGPCTNCKYCEKPVHRDRVLKCIEKEEPVSHLPCINKAMEEEFNSRPVTITQGHLNYLNRIIQFAYRPIPGNTIEELQKIAVETSSLYIKDMTMEDKFRHMKMMEAACANVSIAIHNDKEKIRLVVERADIEKHVKIRDLQKVHDAGYIREKQEFEKGQKQEAARIKGDPTLRAREKTIESMVKMGFSREAAEKFIDKQKNAQGAKNETP